MLPRALRIAVLALPLILPGCLNTTNGPQVVVYTSVDPQSAGPLLDRFTATTGIAVVAVPGATSPTALDPLEQILREQDRPRADVLWNHEILHTLRLEKLGLLAPFESVLGQEFPAEYRSPTGHWYGLAARARVLLVNTDRVHDTERPTTIEDLVDPRRRRRGGLARPLRGTTATHVACLFVAWGDERAARYLDAVKDNARLLADNEQVAAAVAAGELDFGLTDSDQAMRQVELGRPVEIVYPDQQPSELGTLFIPSTVAILRNAPHPEAARQLLEYLVSPEVETALAIGPGKQVPLRASLDSKSQVETPRSHHLRAMQADFPSAAEKWPHILRHLTETFGGQ